MNFKFHNIDQCILESAIGRGDRRLGDVIEAAWKNGAKFDLWYECFDFSIWEKAFEKFDMNVEAVAGRQFEKDDILPWEHLGGPDKQHLLDHLNDTTSKLTEDTK